MRNRLSVRWLAAMVGVGLGMGWGASRATGQVATLVYRQVASGSYIWWMDLGAGLVLSNHVWQSSFADPTYTYCATNSLETGQELLHAAALQDPLGFSALSVGFTDDTRTFSEQAMAFTAYVIQVRNDGTVDLPMRLHMEIFPGQLRLRDETAKGIRYSQGAGANILRTSVDFLVTTNSSASLPVVWRWTRNLEGGRAGASNTVFTVDYEHIGTPPVRREVSPDGTVIEDVWDTWVATLDFGVLRPGENVRLSYEIEIRVSGIDDVLQAGAGTTGALVRAGDPFELTSRAPGAVGSGSVFTVGNLAVGLFKPLKISDPARNGDVTQFTFDADLGRNYRVEYRDALDSGTWQVLTNIPALLAPCSLRIQDSSQSPQRFYRICSP